MPPSRFALRAADGATVTLERYPIVVGRLTPGGPIPDVDLSHLDPNEAVDGRHCELNPEDGGIEVHDLGGISGTWVDGRRLPPGGRALLRPGGSLRVAGVSLDLVATTEHRAPQIPPPPPPGSGFAGWSGPEGSRPAPPPPSAFPEPQPAAAEPPAGDLSAAPPIARRELERGAVAVRLAPGFGLRILRQRRWEVVGDPLTEEVVGEAIAAARRALALSEVAQSGGGTAGDVSLDFVAPPLSGRAYLQVRLDTWAPPADETLRRAAAIAAAGGTLVMSSRSPRRLAAAVARQLDPSSRRPRSLDWADPRSAAPEGWPQLRTGAEGCLVAALEGDPLLLVDPPAAELGAVLAALPRSGGGTLIVVPSASAAAALSRLEAAGSATHAGSDREDTEARMEWLGARVDAVLGEAEGGWILGRPRAEAGRWSIELGLDREGG